MNAKKAKQLRKRARELTQHLPEQTYRQAPTIRLGECTKGAYKALKTGAYHVAV
jgi:hypothetical protein